jgi:predicted O-linked N-acetylglucosamine transferase (SPINDLY family)
MPAAETAQQLFERGNILYGTGDQAAAADYYHRALQIDPELSAASYNLGCALDSLAGPAQALPHFQTAAARRPDWWQARSNLGFALARLGRMAEAAVELTAAAALNPGDAGLRNNLGLALTALGRGEEAHASFLEAIRLDPGYPEAHSNLAVLFERYGRTTESIFSSMEALRLRPDYPEAHHNLANAFKSQGRHDEALTHYREALRLKPDYPEAHSALLFTLCYPAALSPEQLFAEHAAFGAAHSFPAAPHDNDPDPQRALRIGYISADLRDHAVARFIEPVLKHHDRSRFLICCYSNVSVPDATSTRLMGLAGRFVNLAGMPDHEAAALIRRDRIDILVDLSGHTAGNRLTLFARKPAPVQVTWLGYPQTTGLNAMDYRITDAVSDPPGESERFHTERLLRLPDTFSCFAPPAEAPPVGVLPALSRSAISFGSFNNPAKITQETVELWAGALRLVTGSRMLIKGYALADAGSRARLLGLFEAQGIDAGRLELRGNTAGYREHLQLYGAVDIALDCYPYNGTTTTCEALWMGVPVVTLAGRSHRSRVGAALLQSVGLSSLVADSPQNFPGLAAALAQDLERLARLRGALRQRMAGSPLTDGAGFTGHLEAAYRAIWQNWCAKAQENPPGHQHDQLNPADRSDQPNQQPPASAADHAAQAARFLQAGKLNTALGSYLAALRADPSCGEAFPGIEATLNRQLAADFSAACGRDAARLGLAARAPQEEVIQDGTLEQAAAALLTLGFLTPAELACRYLLDLGHRSMLLSRTLAEIALALDAPALATGHLQDAIAMGDGRLTVVRLLKARESARHQPKPKGGERFLLIKAWGYGFWSDVNHLLGQCLVAELTGRTPVVHWGGNSLFTDDPEANAFEYFFEPVSAASQRDLAAQCRSFYPPKWHAGNLAQHAVDQMEGPGSRFSSLYALERREDAVVSDFHYAVHDLVPWIAPGHPLHGMTTDQVYLHLFRRYLKVKPAIAARTESFYRDFMAGGDQLALHVRGGDKGGEDPNLAQLNSLYPAEIERHLREHPHAGLFLITDDAEILSSYRRRYGDRLIHTVATRTSTGQGVHYQTQASRRLLGEEVLVDALLAARCRHFIGNGLSNVSCAVAQMKPWPAGSCLLLGARLDRLRQLTLFRS